MQIHSTPRDRALWVFGRLVLPVTECPPEEHGEWLRSLFLTTVTEEDQLPRVAAVVPVAPSPQPERFAPAQLPDGAPAVTVPFMFDVARALGAPLFEDGMTLLVSARRHRAPIQRVRPASAPVSDEAGTLFASTSPPKQPTDELPRAYEMLCTGQHARAAKHFATALGADSARADLDASNLYNGACAASLALAAAPPGPEREGLAARALEWIREDVKRRRQAVVALDAALEKPVRATRRDALEENREQLLAQIEEARAGDADLAALRLLPTFAAVFAEGETR
ncbi:MAG: hypothetical protein ACRELB_18795 [Polyangiaceae bacterium]